MLAIVICLIAFGGCYAAGRRSLWGGLMATMVVGYFYGIMRANIESRFSHFFFDFAAVGFYLALVTRQDSPVQRFKMRRLMPWVLALAGWPLLLMLIPQQPFMVQLVGLRGQIFFVPFLLVGAMLDGSEMRKFAGGLAILSLIELAFALAEVQFGLQRFYPINEVDQLIYNSMDVAVGTTNAFRIPATFVQAAAYGGNMVTGLPLLLGAMIQEERGGTRRRLLLAALGASALGVFLSASRSQATMLFILGLAATFSGRIKNFPWFGWIGLLAVVATLVVVSPRMQRFVTLQDTTYLKKRVSSSMNSSFADLAFKYPLGNGLGGGGTSMPYFLQAQLRDPVVIENEFGRIMLEQGVPGLALWIGFIFWIFTRPLPRNSDPWYLGKWLARVALFLCFATAPTGLGLLTSIPGTALIMVLAGWIACPNVTAGGTRAARKTVSARPMNPALKTA